MFELSRVASLSVVLLSWFGDGFSRWFEKGARSGSLMRLGSGGWSKKPLFLVVLISSLVSLKFVIVGKIRLDSCLVSDLKTSVVNR